MLGLYLHTFLKITGGAATALAEWSDRERYRAEGWRPAVITVTPCGPSCARVRGEQTGRHRGTSKAAGCAAGRSYFALASRMEVSVAAIPSISRIWSNAALKSARVAVLISATRSHRPLVV
jgi:hypothetical protein